MTSATAAEAASPPPAIGCQASRATRQFPGQPGIENVRTPATRGPACGLQLPPSLAADSAPRGQAGANAQCLRNISRSPAQPSCGVQPESACYLTKRRAQCAGYSARKLAATRWTIMLALLDPLETRREMIRDWRYFDVGGYGREVPSQLADQLGVIAPGARRKRQRSSGMTARRSAKAQHSRDVQHTPSPHCEGSRPERLPE